MNVIWQDYTVTTAAASAAGSAQAPNPGTVMDGIVIQGLTVHTYIIISFFNE